MKKIFAIVAVFVALFCGIAHAAEISEVYISDIDKSILTVKGSADSTEKTLNIVIIKKGETLSEGFFDYSKVSVQEAVVENDTFSASFRFMPAEGVYSINVPNGEIYEFEFMNKNTVLSFVSDLAQKKIPKESIFNMLKRYAESMGITISYAKSDAQQNYVADNFIKYAHLIASDGVSACKHIAVLSKNELEFFEELEKTVVQTNVNAVLYKYANKIGISLSDYERLNDENKIVVLGDFVGVKYTDIEKFKKDFDDSIKRIHSFSGAGSSSSNGGGSITGMIGNSVQIPVINQNITGVSKLTDYFSDIQNCSWAWDAINYLNNKGIMVGMGANTFAPDNSVTREQLAKIIVLALGYYDENAKCNFTDIPNNDWSQSYVASAYNNGLMLGLDNNKFGYGQPMSRQDICVVIYRAALKSGFLFEKDGQSFIDDSDISDYAKEAISKLTGALIVYGMGDRTFMPKSSVTRAQAANLIYLLMSKIQ